jgi:hypothetical protein
MELQNPFTRPQQSAKKFTPSLPTIDNSISLKSIFTTFLFTVSIIFINFSLHSEATRLRRILLFMEIQKYRDRDEKNREM